MQLPAVWPYCATHFLVGLERDVKLDGLRIGFLKVLALLFHAPVVPAVEVLDDADSRSAWEEYARATFTAHMRYVPPEKHRFLQYVTPESRPWWEAQRENGAVLLGKSASDE